MSTTAAPTPASTTTTAAPTTTTPAVEIPSPLEALPIDAALVVASVGGIDLLDDAQSHHFWSEPTAIAFMIGEGLVVAQRAETSNIYPRPPTGPIITFDPSRLRAFTPPDGETLMLHDAGIVDGQPTALATSRSGNTPSDTTEQLLLVDLTSGNRNDLGTVGGWEWTVYDARLTAAGIALAVGDVDTKIELRSFDGDLQWSVPGPGDTSFGIAATETALTLVEPAFDGTDPILTIIRYDLGTGAERDTTTIALTLRDGATIDGGFCFHPEWQGDALLCDQTYGGPITIDPSSGIVKPATSLERGVATVVRAASR